MRRRLTSIDLPPLVRLLLLFAILIIPLLAERVIAHLRGEALSHSPPTTPDALRLKG